MGSGSSQSSGSAPTTLPALQPLMQTTADTLQNAQQNVIGGTWGANPQGQSLFQQMFLPQTQNIPGMSNQATQIANSQYQRAYTDPITGQEQIGSNLAANLGNITAPEQQAIGQANYLTGGPLGQSPATLAAMNAVRTPVMQDLALAGLGNSDAVASNQAAAFAPILAQEMQMRAGVIPQLANIGANLRGGAQSGASLLNQLGGTLANRQTQNYTDAATAQEAQRQIAQSQGLASYNDLMRQFGAAQGVTTGVLGQIPTGALSRGVGSSTSVGGK